LVAEDGSIKKTVLGRTLRVAPGYDSAVEGFLGDLVQREGTLSLDDYVIREDEFEDAAGLSGGKD
jgi:hypothetical protein